mmetsp:Transcript_11889/g.36633  ORF Transcript_11889/g.36633 Transcript_11889/m.36633 type:complete len:98 (+) Transcript_11889:222-515(+)
MATNEAAAGLEKVTDFHEDKGLDGAKANEALSAIASTVDEQAEAERLREAELAAVSVNKADVDLIVAELEVPKEEADRALRVHKGDVVAALRALVNA